MRQARSFTWQSAAGTSDSMTENEDIAKLWEESLHLKQRRKEEEKSFRPPERQPDDSELALLEPEKRKILETLQKLKRRTTPSELAAASGLSIDKCSFWLNKIAGETQGTLEVAADGTIHYTFPHNFTDAYLKRGLLRAALVVGTFLFQLLYWVVRVSFGVALVLSVLIVVVLIIAVFIASISGNDSGGGGGGDSGGGGSFDFFDARFLSDLFYWNYSPSRTYYPNSYSTSRKEKYNSFAEDKPKGNFFLDCFSFLFGDGAPNERLMDVRWNQIARIIQENGGVVSTEQLAPFLDGNRSDSGMILTALAQFNGRPEVTKSGYIVYVFPSYLKRAPVKERDMPFLAEDPWKFSGASPGSIIFVVVLAMVNFAGSWWLFKHIATIAMLQPLHILIDVLLTYAIVFIAIPIVRYFVLQVLNQRIQDRNNKREAAYQLLMSQAKDVMEEIEEAKEIRRQELALTTASSDQIVYSSQRDSVEQQFDQFEQQTVSPQPISQPTDSSNVGAKINIPPNKQGLRKKFGNKSDD